MHGQVEKKKWKYLKTCWIRLIASILYESRHELILYSILNSELIREEEKMKNILSLTSY